MGEIFYYGAVQSVAIPFLGIFNSFFYSALKIIFSLIHILQVINLIPALLFSHFRLRLSCLSLVINFYFLFLGGVYFTCNDRDYAARLNQ